MSEKIMVVKRKKLFNGDYFKPFRKAGDVNFIERILDNYTFICRDEAEYNSEYKQPVAYITIINPGTQEVFVSQRASNKKDYHEKRLYGTWGFGIGGHVRKTDDIQGNPVYNSILRELTEEVEFSGFDENLNLKLMGYINSEKGVSKFHFGLWYIFFTNSKKVCPKSKEINSGRLMKISQIEKFLSDKVVEDWTKVCFEPLMNDFGIKELLSEDGMSWFYRTIGASKGK